MSELIVKTSRPCGWAACLVLCFITMPSVAQQPDYSLYDEIAAQRQIVGPFIGHVTDDTASVWAYAGPRTAPLVLEVAAVESASDDAEAERFRARIEATPDPEQHFAVEFNVAGLAPKTTYAVSIRLANDASAVEPGTFTTAPAEGSGSKFRVAISSCFGGAYDRKEGRTEEIRGEYHNDSWQLLMDQRPDLQLIIGDNVYANSTDYNHLWDAYTLERFNNRPFAEAVRTIPTYAVWDDHDYGPNNSDGTTAGKENSLRAFNEVFANPPRTGSDAPGIFTSFGWGGVDFFLLDGRYHRTPNEAPDNPEKRLLGKEQLAWLIDELKHSDAPFKLLVCGSTWEASPGDGWRLYRFERKRLWNAIVENKINGVVFVSGDTHWCDLRLHGPEVDGAYWMPEIISSGLGSHGKHDPMGFVTVDFDTTRDDPLMTARVIDGTGLETATRRIRASDLAVRGE